eukprot:5484450-Karenia_brevis.AAC.1
MTQGVRGKADSMSASQQTSFQDALKLYIVDKQQKSETIWSFGAYGKASLGEGEMTDKSAPIIPDLLVNMKLWLIFLAAMPYAKMKDVYVKTAIENIMAGMQGVNDTGLSNLMFVTWLCKVTHMCMTHIRHLAQYPPRYEYRVAQLAPDQ